MHKDRNHITILFILIWLNTFSQNIDSLYTSTFQNNSDKQKLEILNKLTKTLRQKKLGTSLPTYLKLIQHAKSNKDSLVLSKAYLELGKKYQDESFLETSELYLDSVFNFINNNNTIEYQYILSNTLTTKGNLLKRQGFTEEAIKYFQESLIIAQKNNFFKYIIFNQNNIGALLLDEDKPRKASAYFIKNLKNPYIKNFHTVITLSNLNLAECYKRNQQIDSTRICLQIAEEHASNNPALLIHVYLSKAELALKYQDYNKANTFIDKSFRIDSLEYDTYIYKGYAELLQGNYNNSTKNYYIALEIIKDKSFFQKIPEIYDSLSKVYQAQGKYKEANEYLLKSINLSDSLNAVDRKFKLTSIQKKYKIRKKELKIINQKEKIKDEIIKMKRSNILMIISAIILFILFIILFGRNQKQQQAHKMAVIEKINSERNRIARDLHDNLGAHLSFIISSIDNILFAKNLNHQMLISKIKEVKEFAAETTSLFRDTTWALNKDVFTVEDFINRLEIFINRIKKSNPGIKVYLINQINTNLVVNPVESLNIFRILQEAINNSVKYSKADKTAVFFEENDTHYIFKIIDHGIGFDQEKNSIGYGLKNMKRRISELGGTIAINSENGTEIIIHLPKEKTN